MDAKSQGILNAALALPDPERAAITQQLLASLAPEVDDLTEDEWAAELDRRAAEFEQNPTMAVPWAELKQQE